jgi:hypothetical protein
MSHEAISQETMVSNKGFKMNEKKLISESRKILKKWMNEDQSQVEYFIEKYKQKMNKSTLQTSWGWVNGISELSDAEKQEVWIGIGPFMKHDQNDVRAGFKRVVKAFANKPSANTYKAPYKWGKEPDYESVSEAVDPSKMKSIKEMEKALKLLKDAKDIFDTLKVDAEKEWKAAKARGVRIPWDADTFAHFSADIDQVISTDHGEAGLEPFIKSSKLKM